MSLPSFFGVHFSKQVISRRGKNENVYEMYKNEKCPCEAFNTTVFHRQLICKFETFLSPPSCHCRRPTWLIYVLRLTELNPGGGGGGGEAEDLYRPSTFLCQNHPTKSNVTSG